MATSAPLARRRTAETKGGPASRSGTPSSLLFLKGLRPDDSPGGEIKDPGENESDGETKEGQGDDPPDGPGRATPEPG